MSTTNTPPDAGGVVDFDVPPSFDQWGTGMRREVIHLVDFDTDNPLNQDSPYPDRTFCGNNTDATPCDPPAYESDMCGNCRKKAESPARLWISGGGSG